MHSAKGFQIVAYATCAACPTRRLPTSKNFRRSTHLFLTLPVYEEAVLVDFEHTLWLVVERIFFLVRVDFVNLTPTKVFVSTNLSPAVEDASLLQIVGHWDAPVKLVLLGHFSLSPGAFTLCS